MTGREPNFKLIGQIFVDEGLRGELGSKKSFLNSAIGKNNPIAERCPFCGNSRLVFWGVVIGALFFGGEIVIFRGMVDMVKSTTNCCMSMDFLIIQAGEGLGDCRGGGFKELLHDRFLFKKKVKIPCALVFQFEEVLEE